MRISVPDDKIYDDLGNEIGGGGVGSPENKVYPQGWVDGLQLFWRSDGVDVAAGVCKSLDGLADMTLAATTACTVLDTGALANKKWYHIWMISNNSDGSSPFLRMSLADGISIKPDGTTGTEAQAVPTGTRVRRLGAIRREEGVFLQFSSSGNGRARTFTWNSDYWLYYNASPGSYDPDNSDSYPIPSNYKTANFVLNTANPGYPGAASLISIHTRVPRTAISAELLGYKGSGSLYIYTEDFAGVMNVGTDRAATCRVPMTPNSKIGVYYDAGGNMRIDVNTYTDFI